MIVLFAICDQNSLAQQVRDVLVVIREARAQAAVQNREVDTRFPLALAFRLEIRVARRAQRHQADLHMAAAEDFA